MIIINLARSILSVLKMEYPPVIVSHESIVDYIGTRLPQYSEEIIDNVILHWSDIIEQAQGLGPEEYQYVMGDPVRALLQGGSTYPPYMLQDIINAEDEYLDLLGLTENQ